MILISIHYNNWFSYLCALYNNDFYFIYHIQWQRWSVFAVFESWDPKCNALFGFRITWYSITSFPGLAGLAEPCSISVWKSATFSDCNETRGPNFETLVSEQNGSAFLRFSRVKTRDPNFGPFVSEQNCSAFLRFSRVKTRGPSFGTSVSELNFSAFLRCSRVQTRGPNFGTLVSEQNCSAFLKFSRVKTRGPNFRPLVSEPYITAVFFLKSLRLNRGSQFLILKEYFTVFFVIQRSQN